MTLTWHHMTSHGITWHIITHLRTQCTHALMDYTNLQDESRRGLDVKVLAYGCRRNSTAKSNGCYEPSCITLSCDHPHLHVWWRLSSQCRRPMCWCLQCTGRSPENEASLPGCIDTMRRKTEGLEDGKESVKQQEVSQIARFATKHGYRVCPVLMYCNEI